MLRLTVVRIALGLAVTATLLVSQVKAEEDEKGPPLPFHTIEGYGGGAITPIAYMVNPGPEGQFFGKPAAALSVGNFGDKQLTAITVTETLFQRLELGYGCDRLGLGDLPNDVQHSTTMDMESGDVWLHNFNARFLLVKENAEPEGFPLPAVTAGVHVKVNNGISTINDNLGGALNTIGYHNNVGVDFTLTVTKKFANVLGRPLILTGGLRESQGAQLGFLGFGNKYYTTFEGNAVYMVTDHIVLAYEFRQKTNPYDLLASSEPGEWLIGPENSWHAIDAAYILNNHTTFCAGWGNLGNLANSQANGSWWLQLKYEF
jgi:hypothetical protein